MDLFKKDSFRPILPKNPGTSWFEGITSIESFFGDGIGTIHPFLGMGLDS